MALPSVYDLQVSNNLIARIEKLDIHSKAIWGKMNVAQMLAHCNVTYDLASGKISSNSGAFMKLILKLMVKKTVTNEKPYPQNSRTAPIFIIADEKNFQNEKALLIENIKKVQQQGAAFYEGKESDSFGKLTAIEWNNMFYKHLHHHLSQFGV